MEGRGGAYYRPHVQAVSRLIVSLLQMREVYKKKHGEDFLKRLINKVDDDYEYLVYALLATPAKNDVLNLWVAFNYDKLKKVCDFN